MTSSEHHGRDEAASSVTDDETSGRISRRALLAQAAAVAALTASDLPAHAHSADPKSKEDMVAFLLLSAALTGIDPASLSAQFTKPERSMSDGSPGSDPVNLKADYFRWVQLKQPRVFERLLQIAKDNFKSQTLTRSIVDEVNAKAETRYLGRSIILMWYLGSWYDPADLEKAPATGAFIPSEVISAKAYTQGWIWQIAAAHPMGYSNLQFGYWSRPPTDPNDPKSPLDFKSTLS